MKTQLLRLCRAAGLPCDDDITDLVCFKVDAKLTLMLSVEEDTNLLSIDCDLASILTEKRSEVCRMIATANFRFVETDGSTLGFDPVSGTVALCQKFPMRSLDEAKFPTLITRFLDIAERWQERFASLLNDHHEGNNSLFPLPEKDAFGSFLNARA